MRTPTLVLIAGIIALSSCRKEDPPSGDGDNPELPSAKLYFPDNWVGGWETEDPEKLGWNTERIADLYDYLDGTGTRAFLVLKNGRIVLEHYHGNQLNGQPFDAGSNWYWASAGKTLTAFAVGIAEQEGHLQISDPASQHLGSGWTSCTPSQENAITIEHMLTMTTGLDDGVTNSHCSEPSCLEYLATPGTRWAYHNGPYTKLHDLIFSATSVSFEQYVKESICDKIGAAGTWFWLNDDHVFFSSARSMARFGLLNLSNGVWKTDTILNPSYFADMTSTSQTLNRSYGYLYWLNGKSSYMLPGFQTIIQGSVCPSAPDDMFAGIGKNSQYLNIVPSEGLVVVRMGEDPDQFPVPVAYQEEIWKRLGEIIQ